MPFQQLKYAPHKSFLDGKKFGSACSKDITHIMVIAWNISLNKWRLAEENTTNYFVKGVYLIIRK